MGDERRRHQRVPADVPFRLVGADGSEDAFELIDLSESGARIRCGKSLAAMTEIRVALLLPGRSLGREGEIRLATTGVVVWSHKGEDGQYDTGVFFPALEEEQRDLLQHFVHASPRS